MSSAKRDTAKKKATSEKGEGRSSGVLTFSEVPVKGSSGEAVPILIPDIPGRSSPEQRQRDALRFIQLLGSFQSGEDDREAPDAKAVEEDVDYIAQRAGYEIVQDLMQAGEERFGRQIFILTLSPIEEEIEVFSTVLDAATDRYVAAIRERLTRDGFRQKAQRLVTTALASLILELEDLKDDPERFAEAYKSRYGAHRVGALNLHSKHVAREYLEELKPHEATLEELVALLRQNPPEIHGGTLYDAFTLGTHPLNNAMRKGLLQRNLDHYEEEAQFPGVKQPVKIRTGINLESLAPDQWREDVLTSIQKRLLEEKKQSAALLKLHLDLTNLAYATPGELPIFEYNFSDALERQGYSRNSDRRSFHNETMRAMRQRLITLQLHYVNAWRMTRSGKERLAASPFWVVQEFYFSKQEPLGLVDLTSTFLQQAGAEVYTSALIHPGTWWAHTNMKSYRLPIPESLLQLPTDGNGNERERMALLLATFLAIHVRRNQRQHAGGKVSLRVGTLLEESGITTRDDFFALKSTHASRVRDYLHDMEDRGALPLLRELGAFTVTIRDEADYFAPGRGWREKFWESGLEVEIPDLGIKKERLLEAGKRPSA